MLPVKAEDILTADSAHRLDRPRGEPTVWMFGLVGEPGKLSPCDVPCIMRLDVQPGDDLPSQSLQVFGRKGRIAQRIPGNVQDQVQVLSQASAAELGRVLSGGSDSSTALIRPGF